MLRVGLKLLLDGDPAANVALQHGDTVYLRKMTSFFVLGEVQRQGAFAVDKETTILEAITLAGGFSDRAAPAGVKLLRKRADGSQETLEVNLSGADPRARELRLAEGDTVVVPRGNSFFVVGEVKQPGVYLLDPGTTAFAGLTRAGGVTDRAAPTQGRLIRRLPSGEEQTTLVDLSGAEPRARDLPLQDGDTLLVPAGNLFFVLGEVSRPGAFPARSDDRGDGRGSPRRRVHREGGSRSGQADQAPPLRRGADGGARPLRAQRAGPRHGRCGG